MVLGIFSLNKALVMGPGGLGDQIWMSGAVRYVAKQHQETHLFCSPPTFTTLQTLYKDVPSIKFIIIAQGSNALRTWISSQRYRHIYACAFTKDLYVRYVNMNDIPGVFYDQMEIPRSIRHSHFALPHIPESISLYQTLDQSYIFVHTKSSSDLTPIISWDMDTILTIDPNVNQYAPDHRWYELAQTFIGKPFLHYCEVIKHATELHLVNSSFYTLATQIPPLDAKVKLCYERKDGTIMPHFDFS